MLAFSQQTEMVYGERDIRSIFGVAAVRLTTPPVVYNGVLILYVENLERLLAAGILTVFLVT